MAAGAILAGYAVVAGLLWQEKDFNDTGPLALDSSDEALVRYSGTEEWETETAWRWCFEGQPPVLSRAGWRSMEGRTYLVCQSGATTIIEWVPIETIVVDARGEPVRDVGLLKRGGVWPTVGMVTTEDDFINLGLLLAAVLFFFFFVSRRIQRKFIVNGRTPVVSSLLYVVVLVSTALILNAFVLHVVGVRDPWGFAVTSFYVAALTYGAVAGAMAVRISR